MSTPTDTRTPSQQLALMLYGLGAVKTKDHPTATVRSSGERGFLLKLHERTPDAPLSPIYLNLRTPDNPKPGPLTAEAIELSGRVLYRRATSALLGYDYIAGVPRAGEPFAQAFQRAAARDDRQVPILTLVKDDGEPGSGARKVTGLAPGQEFKPGGIVLIIDDLITQADSKLEAIAALEAAGLRVADVLVLVDRGQGGKQELIGRHVFLSAPFTLRSLLDFYVEFGTMPEDTRDEIVVYLSTSVA
ncbi:MAG: phosphoribosyltransferase family protein [Candidatus Uhrbacteria bacterium]|nr:phosphoribosyltransferase family protein [Candidatus Uhrbacteria bacterium]